MYLRWILYVIFSNIINIICYITNPIVILFCNEEGELPRFLNYWQTWDDSCDSEYYMHNCVPSFLDYGYDNKYTCVESTELKLIQVGRKRLYSKLKPNATFSTKEKVQRYFCRLLWLTRNCAYGFNFWIFGAYLNGITMNYKIKSDETTIGDNGKYFIIHSDANICQIWKFSIRWKLFLGWKIADQPGYTLNMLANRPLITIEYIK